MKYNIENLTSRKNLTKSFGWSSLGLLSPLIMAIIAVPFLVGKLGTERFGILALAWTLVGYFSLFDLGLGRALTKLVSEYLGKENDADLPELIWTGLFMMIFLGIISGIFLFIFTPLLTNKILNISSEYINESTKSFLFIACCVPFLILSIGFQGVLRAFQRFDYIFLIKMSNGIGSFGFPLIVIFFFNNLSYVILGLLFGRIFTMIIAYYYCLRAFPELKSIVINMSKIKSLLFYGIWMSVTNIISPVMNYLDRFFIGGMINVTAVSYYSLPQDFLRRIKFLPLSLVQVLFPALSTNLAANKDKSIQLYRKGLTYIYIMLFPITLIIGTFAYEGISLWIDPIFATNSAIIMKWMAIGVFINTLTTIPFITIQASGRPDITAKFHLIELPIYLCFLWYLLRNFGIIGAVIAWILRIIIDSFLMFSYSFKILPKLTKNIKKWLIIFSISMGIIISMSFIDLLIIYKFFIIFTLLLLFSITVWKYLLENEDKKFFLKPIRLNQII